MNERKLADAIGTTRAAIADLQNELEILESAAKANGIGAIEGDLFRVVVSNVKASKATAWKKVATFMEAPQSVINKFSTTKLPTIKVTCSAQIKTEKAA